MPPSRSRTRKSKPSTRTSTRTRNRTHTRNRTRTPKSKSRHSKEEKLAIEYIPLLLEILDTIKTYHWRTHSYSTHKATDELHEKLSEKTDEFAEVLLGKIGPDRFAALNIPSVRVRVLKTNEEAESAARNYIARLANISSNPNLSHHMDVDLLNIRDEMVAMLNRFLYLLTLT